MPAAAAIARRARASSASALSGVKPRASTDAPREFRWNDGSREAASFDDGQGEPVNPAPAIAEAPRAKPAAQPAVTARAASTPVADLQLGPARVSRE
jgi:hypothetical protein